MKGPYRHCCGLKPKGLMFPQGFLQVHFSPEDISLTVEEEMSDFLNFHLNIIRKIDLQDALDHLQKFIFYL